MDFEHFDLFNAAPGEVLALLVDVEPSPWVMSMLCSIDRSRLSDTEAVAFLQVHQRLMGWLAAIGLDAVLPAASAEPLVEEFTVLVPDSDEERTIRIADVRREELACALRLPASVAQARIDTARLLSGPLAATGEALAVGDVTERHVAVVVEAAGRLPGRWMRDNTERAAFTAACAELQRRVLPTACRGTVAQTRAQARRVLLAIDAAGEARRRREARCTRDVYVADELDGISTLIARLSTETAHAILTQINMTATDDGLEVPAAATAGERRAEALASLVLSTDGGAAQLGAHVDLVIDLPTLLGLQHAAGNDAAGASAELRGAGPIHADVVRDLLADPEVAVTIRRLVTDPLTGHLLDHGRRTYQVPDRLREFIVARDRTCRFPGCARRADRCQIDHADPWHDGGQTSPANLGALCVRHHQLKTHASWQITHSQPDGTCTWTSPQGRAYEHAPPPF